MRTRSRMRIIFPMLSALILALASMTAVFAVGQSGDASQAAVQAQSADDGNGDHCEDSDNKGHKDCKPENNPRPENPPCDADHGHPGENSAKCSDRDGDGTTDNKDKCPDEPGPAENDGCPEDECPDDDGDGVCDADDECPDDPGPAENDGCPEEPCPDADDDGVCDADDQCPDEPGPAENDGCPELEAAACPEGALIDQEIDGVVYACVLLLPAESESAVCPPGTLGPIATGENPLVEACVVLGPTGDEEENGTAAAVSQRMTAVAVPTG